MDSATHKMKWILFVVFLTLFVLATLGTFSFVFLGFGTPTEAEREWLVRGLVIEIATCVIALFYQFFGIKKSGSTDEIKSLEERVSALEIRLDADVIVTKSRVDADVIVTESRVGKENSSGTSLTSSVMDTVYPELASIREFDDPPVFDENVYKLKPTFSEIKKDIDSAKPFDKLHRSSSYEGLNVQWKCAFSSLEEDDDYFNVRVSTDVPLSICTFKLDKSSENLKLKFLNENNVFWLKGQISKVDGMFVKLMNVEIS